jgi:hypothetical protein
MKTYFYTAIISLSGPLLDCHGAGPLSEPEDLIKFKCIMMLYLLWTSERRPYTVPAELVRAV